MTSRRPLANQRSRSPPGSPLQAKVLGITARRSTTPIPAISVIRCPSVEVAGEFAQSSGVVVLPGSGDRDTRHAIEPGGDALEALEPGGGTPHVAGAVGQRHHLPVAGD